MALERGPREYLRWEAPCRGGSQPSPGGRRVTLPSLLCTFGWCGGAIKKGWKRLLSFLKIHFNLSRFWNNHNHPEVSKSFSFKIPSSSLLLLASAEMFWAAINFSVNEFEVQAFINALRLWAPVVWHQLNTEIVNFMTNIPSLQNLIWNSFFQKLTKELRLLASIA